MALLVVLVALPAFALASLALGLTFSSALLNGIDLTVASLRPVLLGDAQLPPRFAVGLPFRWVFLLSVPIHCPAFVLGSVHSVSTFRSSVPPVLSSHLSASVEINRVFQNSSSRYGWGSVLLASALSPAPRRAAAPPRLVRSP